MSQLGVIMHFAALAVLGVAALWLWAPRPRREVLLGLFGVGVALLLVEAVLRWVEVGHPPVFGTWENALSSAFALALTVTLAIGKGWDTVPPLWLRLLAVWPAATLVFGSFFRSRPLPLTISERSIWIDVHVAFAWLAYAVLLSAGMRALAGLIQGGDAETDHAVLGGAAIGFVAFSAMLATGSWYSYQLFSRWYQWEIVETLAAAVWLGYAVVLHARLLLGWRGRAFYWSAVAVLPILLSCFWVWSFYSGTYHFFDIQIIRAG